LEFEAYPNFLFTFALAIAGRVASTAVFAERGIAGTDIPLLQRRAAMLAMFGFHNGFIYYFIL